MAASVPTGLVDQYGRPIVRQQLLNEQAAPTVTGVRQVISGHPAAGLTPGRLASILRSAEQGDARSYLELAEDMEERDLHYAGVLGRRKRAVCQLEITVEAAGEDSESIRHADLVRAWLDRDTLEDELFDLLDGIGKGYAVSEIMWDTSERQWMPAQLVSRDQRWFEYAREDGRSLRLKEGAELLPLAPWKFITHEGKAKSGLPIRGGLARLVAWSFMFKSYAIKDWAIFAETFGQPLRVGKYDPSATQADIDTLLRALRNLGTDAAAAIPTGMMIEFVEAKVAGVGTEIYEKLANWWDQQVSKAVLGQVGTTDALRGGYAVGKVHEGVQGDIERSDAKGLAAALNRDLVRPMVSLNHGPQRAYPRLRIGRPEQVDIDQVGQALERLVPLGLRVPTSWVRDMLGAPEADEQDEVLGAPAVPADPVAASIQAAARRGRAAARSRARKGSRDPADDLAERLAGMANAPIDAMLARIEAMIAEVQSLDELAGGLLALVPELDEAELAGLMQEAFAVAELMGRADILDGA